MRHPFERRFAPVLVLLLIFFLFLQYFCHAHQEMTPFEYGARNPCVSTTIQVLITQTVRGIARQISACTDTGKLMGADDRLTVQIVLKWVYGYSIAVFSNQVFS